ncbi:MAG: hypothetical protein ACRD2Q_02700 [Terriglobales bacterium]
MAAQSPIPQVAPQALVAEAVANALKDADARVPYLYRLDRKQLERSEARDIVSTRDGLVARTVAINGQPLTPQQRSLDDQRLDKLLADPKEQHKRRQQQEKEAQRVRSMIRALPDAFLYEHDGIEPGKDGALVRLKFRPNPEFDPPTRETLVYKGMEGHLWIHQHDRRIARLDAVLVEDVKLGWGLVANLHKGGRFRLEQDKLADGRWQTSQMTLDFTGRAFLFKSIKIKQEQSISNVRRVPDNLSLAEGIELLRKQNGEIAEKK